MNGKPYSTEQLTAPAHESPRRNPMLDVLLIILAIVGGAIVIGVALGIAAATTMTIMTWVEKKYDNRGDHR